MPANGLLQLAIATLGVTFGGAWLATRSGGSDKTKTPPTNASSKDEESFIQYGSHRPNVSTRPLTNWTGSLLRVRKQRRRRRSTRWEPRDIGSEGAGVEVIMDELKSR
jgi:F-type H+-transporting ATPase subunit k